MYKSKIPVKPSRGSQKQLTTHTTSLKEQNYPTQDWTAVLGPVRDQGSCGASWAYAATTVLEGRQAVKSGEKATALSVQQLVDCVGANYGCKGGFASEALFYAEEHGLMTEADYPVQGDHGESTCKYDKEKKAAQVDNVRGVGNPKADLAQGPIIAAFQAQGDVIQYQAGIYNGFCGEQPNHYLAVVGWGVTSYGVEYWIARNSWGPDWGEQGHIRIQIDGNCPLYFDSFPDML